VTQQSGHLPKISFLLILIVQKRPATEVPNSRFESAQKTTTAGANWEIFRFDCGDIVKRTGIFVAVSREKSAWTGR
jgi:hypothetical protein